MNMEKLGQIQLPAPEGPGCWYISTPSFTHICPIGLFVKE